MQRFRAWPGAWPYQEFRADNLRPAWEAALESFGPQRIMFGGDWPVSTRFASYQSTIDVLGALIDELTEDEGALIWGETARRAYGLPEFGRSRTTSTG